MKIHSLIQLLLLMKHADVIAQ